MSQPISQLGFCTAEDWGLRLMSTCSPLASCPPPTALPCPTPRKLTTWGVSELQTQALLRLAVPVLFGSGGHVRSTNPCP